MKPAARAPQMILLTEPRQQGSSPAAGRSHLSEQQGSHQTTDCTCRDEDRASQAQAAPGVRIPPWAQIPVLILRDRATWAKLLYFSGS